jgi:hypothetical protein
MSTETIHFPELVEAWETKFKPVGNHLNPDASWSATMFETFGEEVEFVLSQPDENVWTWIDGDGDDEESSGTFLVSGFHHVNRIGYFVCEVPWTEFEEVRVELFPLEDEDDD